MSDDLTEAEIIERLEAGLRRMPKVRREIFIAVRFDRLSYPEIAERTGLSAEQVERQFAKSLLTLLDAIEERAPAPWWKRLFRRFTRRQLR